MAETFQEAAARIAAMPAVIEAKVTSIQLDASPAGVLTRLDELALSAHQRGDISAVAHQEIAIAITALKVALSKVDHTVLLRGVAIAPAAKALR